MTESITLMAAIGSACRARRITFSESDTRVLGAIGIPRPRRNTDGASHKRQVSDARLVQRVRIISNHNRWNLNTRDESSDTRSDNITNVPIIVVDSVRGNRCQGDGSRHDIPGNSRGHRGDTADSDSFGGAPCHLQGGRITASKVNSRRGIQNSLREDYVDRSNSSHSGRISQNFLAHVEQTSPITASVGICATHTGVVCSQPVGVFEGAGATKVERPTEQPTKAFTIGEVSLLSERTAVIERNPRYPSGQTP